MDLQSDEQGNTNNTSLSFFPKISFLFHLLQVEWKKHIVSFREDCSNNSRIVYGLWSRYSSFIKSMGREWRLLNNLVSIFQVQNVSHRKTEKTLNIFDNIQPIFIKFSSKWSHCVWSSNSCSKCPWKCRSRLKFTKMLIFYIRIYFKKNSQSQILLTGISSQNFQIVSEFGITTANDNCCCFQKFCSAR